jgi:PAS domain S-box-containing protein
MIRHEALGRCRQPAISTHPVAGTQRIETLAPAAAIMIEKYLQDRASLYVCGALSPEEREDFEVLLQFQEELRQLVDDLQEVASSLAVCCSPPAGAAPGSELKSRLLAEIARQGPPPEPVALVVSGPDRLVQWINPQFTQMCGYSLEELRGKNLGPILQGKETDPAAVARMREALHHGQPARETIVNYHKNGSPYRVEIAISPIRGDRNRLCWFIAREHLVEHLV